MHKLITHALIPNSKVNGPGSRITLWTQGCTKACPGCFNPETWTKKGTEENIEDVYNSIKNYIDNGDTGITVTGGDPLEQPEALLSLLKKIDENLLDKLPDGIIVFTGYTLQEIINLPSDSARKCLDYIDLLIDGRYEKDNQIHSQLSGSANQNFHFNCTIGRGESRIPKDTIMIDHGVELHECWLGDDVFHITGFPRIDRAFFRNKGIEIK